MSFGFGFSLPAILRKVAGYDPFNQSGPTLDLVFAGVATDLDSLGGYTLTTDFIVPQYQIAAQYTVWENGMGLVSKSFSDIITFTRASTATYFDSAGVLQSAANNVPRFDYNPATLAAQGLLIEEQRTNSIRNNTMVGAVAGTPGTPPTNWNIVSSASGLTREIVGTGTENGIAYVDIRWSGTSTSAGSTRTTATTTTEVAALTSQTWTISKYLKLAGGNFPGALSIVWQERDSGGTPVMTVSTTIGTPTAAALNTQRYFDTQTLSGGASVAYVTARVDVDIPDATVVDFTLRIGLPQLEQGAFPTSVIPTTTTALTRAADVASVNTLSPWFNASEGTLFGEYSVYTSSGAKAIAQISDGTFNNRIQFFTNAGDPYSVASRLVSGGAATSPSNTGSVAVGAVGKVALAYAIGANQGGVSVNGSAVITSSPASAFSSVTALELGKGLSLPQLSGWLRRITYWPRRLANSELQAVTS